MRHNLRMTLETKSPFPGCDPYLQERWESCHAQMVVALGELLRGRLPSGLRPRIEARVYLEQTDPEGNATRSSVKPDAVVIEHSGSFTPPRLDPAHAWTADGKDDGGTLIAEPITFTTIPAEMKERYIDIVDVNDGGRIITSIELLSPSNKTRGPGLQRFREKQDMMSASGVSLVEIDLIRGGVRAISAPPTLRDSSPDILFRVAILRSWELAKGVLYALTLRHRLPVIDLPLRRTDPPLTLDLQLMHDVAYDRGEFGIDLNYRKEPDPPLSAQDADWNDKLLRSKGLR